MPANAVIAAQDLSAGYRSTPIWKGANFVIDKGEFIGLLGPNGAGKTTLLRLLLGQIKPINGTLSILGAKPKRGNSNIGYVPQRRYLDSESKIQAVEYVRLGLSGVRWGFSVGKNAKVELKRAHQVLKLVDAENLALKPLSELSGGELQRIFLAQALVSKPDILLLDEPLANLDIRRGSQLINLVSKIAKQENITIVLIAHDINPLLPVIDRIMYIANGKVVSGKIEDIVTNESLTKLYEAPIEVLRDSKGRLAVLGVEEAIHHVE